MKTNKIEVLKTAQEYIASLQEGIIKAANYYQSGEESKGSDIVIQICDGIEWLAQALTVSSDSINLQQNIKELNEKLTEMVEAFKNEDYISIGDLLEYEVSAILDKIQIDIKNVYEI